MKKNGLVIEEGKKCWYKNGILHTYEKEIINQVSFGNGDMCFYFSNGDCIYTKNGLYDTTVCWDIPIKINGNKYWYKDGKLHRLCKPAIEYSDGRKEWYSNGRKLNISADYQYPNYMDYCRVFYKRITLQELWRQDEAKIKQDHENELEAIRKREEALKEEAERARIVLAEYQKEREDWYNSPEQQERRYWAARNEEYRNSDLGRREEAERKQAIADRIYEGTYRKYDPNDWEWR